MSRKKHQVQILANYRGCHGGLLLILCSYEKYWGSLFWILFHFCLELCQSLPHSTLLYTSTVYYAITLLLAGMTKCNELATVGFRLMGSPWGLGQANSIILTK
jgi:hypothetical protein